jgi:hypothetical protein
MPLNPDRFRIYRLAESLKSGKSADCIIANASLPNRNSEAPMRLQGQYVLRSCRLRLWGHMKCLWLTS